MRRIMQTGGHRGTRGLILMLLLAAGLFFLNFSSVLNGPSHQLDLGVINQKPLAIDDKYPSFEVSEVADIRQGDLLKVLLTKDGRVYAAGKNNHGGLANGRFGGESAKLQLVSFPEGTNIKQIDLAHNHVIALDDKGSVWTWGRNLSGQLGTKDRKDRNKPVKVMSGATDIAAGYRFSAAIKSNGDLWAWGMHCDPAMPGLAELTQRFAEDISVGGSYYGGEGPEDMVECLNEQNLPIASLDPKKVEATGGFTSVSGGYGHLLMLDEAGKAWAYGCNGWGQLGIGHNQNNSKSRSVTPVQFPSGVKIAELDAGFRHSLARDTDGKLWSWGHNEKGEAATVDYGTSHMVTPKQIKLPNRVQSVDAGRDMSGAIMNNAVYAAGDNEVGQISMDQAHKGVYFMQSFVKVAEPANRISLGYSSILYWSNR